MVHVTRDLLTVLLDHAAEAAPDDVSIQLTPTPAGELDEPPDVDQETPVLTHFTIPDVAGSVNAVFGVDLGTPAGRGKARFVSHPDGVAELTEGDDLAAVVLVSVPPFEPGNVFAFDRAGRELELTVVDAVPPDENALE